MTSQTSHSRALGRSFTVRPPPFQRFLDDHRDDVYRYLLAAVGPDDADDCFQETFLAALHAYPDLRGDANLRGWVLTIAHNKAVDVHRRRKRAPIAVAEPPDAVGDGSPALADAGLWAKVRRLSGNQRDALVHRFVNDYSYTQIAALLGCSEQAARQRVHAGLTRLREDRGA